MVSDLDRGIAAMDRILLLVDDEPNILKSMKRTFRKSGYQVLTAENGVDALELLAQHKVGVICSDQRMPIMSGSEFLGRAKDLYPDTVRIMLSGYTDLQSVTESINQGAIYKFLTKPWEDDLLRSNIEGAFEYYELRSENQRLNEELSRANEDLERRVVEKTHSLTLTLRTLEIAQRVLEQLPVAVLGLDPQGTIAVANHASQILFDAKNIGLVGRSAEQALPKDFVAFIHQAEDTHEELVKTMCGDGSISVCLKSMVNADGSVSGQIICALAGEVNLAPA